MKLIVPMNVMPQQVDGFPDGCARSREGALHIRPGTTVEITEDEAQHLRKAHLHLFSSLIPVLPIAPPSKAAPQVVKSVKQTLLKSEAKHPQTKQSEKE